MADCIYCGGVISETCFDPQGHQQAAFERDNPTPEDKQRQTIDTIAALYRIWQKYNPPRFTWTDEPPTKEGWFWLLRGESARVVSVTRQPKHGNKLWVEVKPEGWIPIDHIQNALWAGPIPHPNEP